MNKKYFNMFLMLSAFLMPVYMIYHPSLAETSDDPFVKSLWKFVIAGFCFYGVIAVMVFAVK